MRKVIISSVIFFAFIAFGFSKEIPIDLAKTVAKNLYFERCQKANPAKFEEIKISSQFSKSYMGIVTFYVFNISNNKGYVIIAADDRVFPVLSYTFTGTFKENDTRMPTDYIWWLERYQKEILWAVNNNFKSESKTLEAWDYYLTPKELKSIDAVAPLLDPITWDQSCYYNALCPTDAASGAGYCNKCPTGCVATAMSQILKFHEFPPTGVGQNSYTSSYGTETADFGATTYNWSNMPDNVTADNNDVATVLYHAGVSVNMDYAPDGSGASTADARNAFVNNFRYSSDALYADKTSYTDPIWKGMIKSDLDNGWPILYHGSDPAGGGGHAFVLDGYQGAANDHFHFNWGWGGSYNSYNYLTSLIPGGTGTGGGSGNYTDGQGAIFHIHPSTDYYPTADFVADSIAVPVGGTVSFTDLSTTPTGTTLETWSWTLSGGTPATSNIQNPIDIQYNATGTYNVKLIVTNAQGSDTMLKTLYIKVVPRSTVAPHALFNANTTNILEGGTVNFTDQSTGLPYHWQWEFEGGTPAISYDQNPSGVSYSTAGDYNVKLKILNSMGRDSLTKTDYIHVLLNAGLHPPVADFTASPRLVTVGQEVYFTDLSTNNPMSWNWTFTGATVTTSIDQFPPTVTYDSSGIYPVTLTVTNTNGSHSLTKTEYIIVTDLPIPSICDTLSNMGTSPLWKKQLTDTWGWLPGHNGKAIKAYAEKFEDYTTSQVSTLIFPVYKAKYGNQSTSYVKFTVWNDTLIGGAIVPGSVLGYKKVFIKDLRANMTNTISFSPPINVDGVFFTGFEINYGQQDTVALYMAYDRGLYGLNTMYVKQNNNWYTSKQIFNISTSLSMSVVGCLVGINELFEDDQILLYPNPTTGTVNLSLKQDVPVKDLEIKVIDILGKEKNIMLEKTFDNTYNINLSGNENGIYFISIKYNNKIYTKKISLVQ